MLLWQRILANKQRSILCCQSCSFARVFQHSLTRVSSPPVEMKFKIHIGKETRHAGVLSCVDWAKNDEVYTIRYKTNAVIRCQ